MKLTSPLALFAAAAIAFAGCAHQWKGPIAVHGPTGTPICALHHTPLSTKKGYYFDGCFLEIEPDAAIRARFPNPWPSGVSDKPDAKWFPKTMIVSYCESCEAERAEVLRRLRR